MANTDTGHAKWHIDESKLRLEHGRGVIWLRPIIDAPPGEAPRKFCVFDGEIYEIQSSSMASPDGSLYTFIQHTHAAETGANTIYMLHGGDLTSEQAPAMYTVQGMEECKHCAQCSDADVPD